MSRLSPADAAQNLYAMISRALSGAALEDYGLSVSREQGDQLLRELLSLCLFWAWSALDSRLSDKDRDRVWTPFMQRLHDGWSPELGLPPDNLAHYETELAQRWRLYESLTREGAAPAAVAAEAAGVMEADSLIEPEDRPKLLALLVDLVPADELGEAVEELELID
ncbi:MAG TPA: hypothetical protein VGA17_00160 [Nitrospiraceae bacterium]|jgi:hypothetical protein